MTDMLRQDVCDQPLVEVASRIERRELSPVEVTNAVFDRIAKYDETLNAFVTVLAESAHEEAKRAEDEIRSGRYRGTLHGIPVTVKDIFATAGIRTTAGARILSDDVPTVDATVVSRLRDAGAILVGKTNMLEFAYASIHPDFGATPNPWDLTRTTSGSSSGSAAATVAGMGYGTLGTDTGGSIRLPSAYCGIVGLKPTYGRVSRHGVIPVSWSCDHVGPMTRTVQDCAAMLQAIAGKDPMDSTSGNMPVPDYLTDLDRGVQGLRIGISDAYFTEHVDPEIQRLVEHATRELESQGATIEHVTLPTPSEAVPTLLAIIMPEAAAYHLPWLQTRPADYSEGVRERLELGSLTPAVSYIHAQRVRRRIVDEMKSAMDTVDVLAMPTSPVTATPIDEDLVMSDEADSELLAALINFTGPFDLCGFPALTLPCGFNSDALPVGLQLVARPYAEDTLLAAAFAYESATDWHRRRPPLLDTVA